LKIFNLFGLQRALCTLLVARAAMVAVVVAAVASPALAQSCATAIRASNPTESYTVVANAAVSESGTVTDVRTGLVWDRFEWGRHTSGFALVSGPQLNWQDALLAGVTANATGYKGFSDWRVPNMRELRSLVEECRLSPSINSDVFPSAVAGNYWSSTPTVATPTGAWYVEFASGNADYRDRANAAYVRLVRGGQ
jgi:hypothetical protein